MNSGVKICRECSESRCSLSHYETRDSCYYEAKRRPPSLLPIRVDPSRCAVAKVLV
jgi:hypothetical protein